MVHVHECAVCSCLLKLVIDNNSTLHTAARGEQVLGRYILYQARNVPPLPSPPPPVEYIGISNLVSVAVNQSLDRGW